MPNNFNQSNPQSTPHPMYGIRRGWNISDAAVSYGNSTSLFTSITANTVSAVQNPQARYISVAVTFSDPTTTCNVDLYQSVSGTDTLVLSTPVSFGQATANFGNYEFINMQGGTFKIGISNMSNSSPISVAYQVTG